VSRRHRDEAPGALHHVVPQGNGRRRIVEDDHDRKVFSYRFERVSRELGWTVYASCLMDTHQHAVLETAEPNLGLGMRRLQGGHARWFNARHGRDGSVFRQHVWSRRIVDEAHLFRACLYVVLNPVAAGLCDHPEDWPWCSYRRTAKGDPSADSPGERRLLELFGDTPGVARRNYAELVGRLAETIRSRRVTAGADLWRSIDIGECGQRTSKRQVSD
jgi:REP element-mobilizing transposase RayT